MSTDNEDEITVYAKPHLDPQDVRSLAASIPNCSQVNPPNECTIPQTVKPTESSSSYFSSTDGSYFSSFSRRLQQTFSSEQDSDEKNKDGSSSKAKCVECHEVVSFLVSDAYSIEKLAAEAEGKHGSTSELEGAGIARVDVYCQSGTVITCRLIQTNEADDPAANGAVSSPGSSFMQILPTPRKGNHVTNPKPKDNSTGLSGGTQLRRIIRRKCTLEGLKRILEDPPKLPEIDSVTMEDDNTDDDDDDDASQSSTVSKKLLQRKQQRSSASKSKHKSYKSQFSNKQQDFLQKQQLKYEKRIMRDEKVRQHVGNAILAAGMEGGCEAMYLTPFKSMSLEEKDKKNNATTTDQIIESESSELSSSSIISHTPGSDAYHCQKAIQDKIEVADMGLAILMGEAQRLEKMMEVIKKEKGLDEKENEENGKKSSLGSGSKHNRSVGGGYDTDRSFSTFQSTDRDVGSDDDDADESSDSEDSMDSQQRQAIKARKMQGCDVEYSFPNELHDELEAALMNEQDEDDDDDDGSSSSDSSDDESRDVEESRRRGRGRSPPKNNGEPGGSGGKQPRSEEISPIVAIPTNGEGCIVLRENGTFDVIGTIPHMLQKELFKSTGPLPEKVFLGSKGRYFVQFKDGSYHFYGPPELGKLLSKLDKQRRQTPKKDRARARRVDEVSVVCIAFGKELDDFFVVYSDGSWNANGYDLPKGIEKLMQDRRGTGDLTWVAIGDKGEWCVRSMNGGVWWKHVSEEADEALTFVLSHYCENDLEYIDFGADGSFFLLHK